MDADIEALFAYVHNIQYYTVFLPRGCL